MDAARGYAEGGENVTESHINLRIESERTRLPIRP